MISIKIADLSQTEDQETLIYLLDAYACDPMGGGETLSNYCKTHLATTLHQRNDCVILFAFSDNQPTGLLTAFEGFSTFQCKPLLNIHDIAVIDGYRQQGIATSLLKKVEEIARQRNYCKLTLEVLSGNQPAQQAYTKYGFRAYELDETKGKAWFWEKALL